MSVDDRDFVEEAVTTELGWFAPPPKEPPKFMAMGTVVDDEPPAFLAMGTHVDAEHVREEDLEVTQPIPKMTMAELVYAPTDVAMRRTEPRSCSSPSHCRRRRRGARKMSSRSKPVLARSARFRRAN